MKNRLLNYNQNQIFETLNDKEDHKHLSIIDYQPISKKDIPRLVILLAVVAMMLFVGCTRPMKVMPQGTSYAPKSDKALMIFLRPSYDDRYRHESPGIYIRQGDQLELVALSSAWSKIAYYARPGRNIYMVDGETADFLQADVVANKTYYVQVSPRMGIASGRYSLRAVKKDNAELASWLNRCNYYEKTPKAAEYEKSWAEHAKGKWDTYFREWDNYPAATKDEYKQILRAEDGR